MGIKVIRMFDVNEVKRADIERAALGANLTRGDYIKSARRLLDEMNLQWVGDIDNVYRIFVGFTVEVVCLGIGSVDSKEVEGVYATVDDLPTWMQERIAVLSMMKVDPPQTKIAGIGMRVDDNVYWVLRG